MKALCKTQPAKGAEYIDVDIPQIKKDELLVKIYKTSICGSDIPVYNYTGWAPQRIPIPFIFGHELCGTVVEVGADAYGFEKGDFISIESHVWCGQCYECRHNHRDVCAHNQTIGLDRPGGFAEYAAIPARCGWKHKDESLKDIGSIMEPLGNAVYATLANDINGKTVLVNGMGAQGLFAANVAKACGAAKVIATETSAFRKKLAEQMGADRIIDPSESGALEKIIRASGDEKGVDVVIEMSGHPAGIDLALRAIKPAGHFVAFGLPGGPVTLDYANLIVFKGVQIQGLTGRQVYESWYTMDALLRSGKIDPRPVITHQFEMKDFDKAFAAMTDPERKCGKVIMVP